MPSLLLYDVFCHAIFLPQLSMDVPALGAPQLERMLATLEHLGDLFGLHGDLYHQVFRGTARSSSFVLVHTHPVPPPSLRIADHCYPHALQAQAVPLGGVPTPIR